MIFIRQKGTDEKIQCQIFVSSKREIGAKIDNTRICENMNNFFLFSFNKSLVKQNMKLYKYDKYNYNAYKVEQIHQENEVVA